MDTPGHACPTGGRENAADADGALFEQERLVNDEGVRNEYLAGSSLPGGSDDGRTRRSAGNRPYRSEDRAGLGP